MDDEARDALSDEIEAMLAAAELFIAVEVTPDGLELVGEVDSERNRQAAMDIARVLADPAGVALSDAMTVEQFLPDDALDGETPAAADGVADLPDGPEDDLLEDEDGDYDDSTRYDLELEPDFAGGVGTTDTQRVVEEGETYFPPTDPVIRPVDTPQELEVLGGFEATSMDAFDGPNGPEDDNLVAARIREALRLDALTTDLTVGVLVRGEQVVLYGEVPSLDDAEAAQAVAADAAGGRDVEEQLKIAGDQP